MLMYIVKVEGFFPMTVEVRCIVIKNTSCDPNFPYP